MIIPADFPVRPVAFDPRNPNHAQCNTCNRAWDDSIATAYTPAPSARCPFEHFHETDAPPRIAGLTEQDTATILAALRYYQQNGQGEPDNRADDIHDIATAGDAVISLDSDGIDALCERINTAEAATPAKGADDQFRPTGEPQECDSMEAAVVLAERTLWQDDEGVRWVPEASWQAALSEIQRLEGELYPITDQPATPAKGGGRDPSMCPHRFMADGRKCYLCGWDFRRDGEPPNPDRATPAGGGDLPELPEFGFCMSGSHIRGYTAEQMRAIRDAGIEYGRGLAAGSAPAPSGDTKRLDWLTDEVADLRPVAYPIADTGDADVVWEVITYHMDYPKLRRIGSGETPRDAIDEAMAAAPTPEPPK